MTKFRFQFVVRYFFRGLLVVVPLALTLYIIYVSLQWIDSLVPINIPGLGLLIVLATITIMGYLATFFVTKPIVATFERYVVKIPLVNIIYTSIKDLIEAFVGDKKKFNKPVLVSLNQEKTLFKLGFITKEDVELLGLPGMVSVYLPHSYNFSGNHFLVSRDYVTPLHISGTVAMKFIVSGGVSELD
jgi:uncharacterized membrane protein